MVLENGAVAQLARPKTPVGAKMLVQRAKSGDLHIGQHATWGCWLISDWPFFIGGHTIAHHLLGPERHLKASSPNLGYPHEKIDLNGS